MPVLTADLPISADWLDAEVQYAYDGRAEVAEGFDRVGYCLQLDDQWVWTAFDAISADPRSLALPTDRGTVFRQRVEHLEVASSVPGLKVGADEAGYVEMWPYRYEAEGSRQVPGTSDSLYDADDNPLAGQYDHGSFQIHALGDGSPMTLLAVNGFTAQDQALDVGVGNANSGNPDWTNARNAGQYDTRRMTVYARPSAVLFEQSPQSQQLYPRDPAINQAMVPVSGIVVDPAVTAVQVQVTSAGEVVRTRTKPLRAGDRTFSFALPIEAGLMEYAVEVFVLDLGPRRRVASWSGLVAGDAFVVQGQSNAVAQQREGSSRDEESPWIRSFGNSTSDPVLSVADSAWHYAVGDTSLRPGSVGQWALRMAGRIVDTYGIPVAIINGGQNGRPIGFFQRNDADPRNITTNYGRLLQRIDSAGLADALRAILWYQGEGDANDAATHVSGFTALAADWYQDYGDDLPMYVHQVRASRCGSGGYALREAQRQLGDTMPGVTVLSTNGIGQAEDGCHFTWPQYRVLGDRAFATVARDLYGGPSDAVEPPNPRAARLSPDAATITVELRNSDPLTVDAGSEDDFAVYGVDGNVITSVSSVRYEPGRLVLLLSSPALGAKSVSYLGNLLDGPWITNANGIGLLTFHQLPLDRMAALHPAQVSGEPGDSLELEATVSNLTSKPLQGEARLRAPDDWAVSPENQAVDLQPGEATSFNVVVDIPRDAELGNHTIELALSYVTGSGETRETGDVSEIVVAWRNVAAAAEGATATASSHFSNFVPQAAIDGNREDSFSRWVSGTGDQHWLQVDFAEPSVITTIDLYHYRNFELVDYTLEALTADGWQTVATVTGNAETQTSHRFDQVIATAIRLNVTNGTDNRARLYEIEAYGMRDDQ